MAVVGDGSGSLCSAVEAYKPYVVMILVKLCHAGLLILLQAVLSGDGVSPTILVVYENLIAGPLLAAFALLFDKGKWPKLSFHLLFWVSVVSFLRMPMGQLLSSVSLRYTTATFQSAALNTTPAVVLAMAAALRREPFRFWAATGQAKLWGVVTSVAGATVMVIQSSPDRPIDVWGWTTSGWYLGCLMVGIAILSDASSSLLLEWLAKKYPVDLSLSAMINVSGTVQLTSIAVITERDPSLWTIKEGGSLQLLTILYGGTVAVGLSTYAANWCIHKEGPVFVAAFSPLLLVFSLLLKVLLLGGAAHIESIVGAVLVTGGLYLVLWAKSEEHRVEMITREAQIIIEGSNMQPLL